MEEQSGSSGSGVCNQFPFEHLPKEIQLKILSYLDLARNKQDFNNLNQVSKGMQELAWDESFYKEFNFKIRGDSVPWWHLKPPFVLEKLEKVTVDWHSKTCGFFIEILNETPKLRCIEIRGHDQKLDKALVDIIKGAEHVEFALFGLTVEGELASNLKQVTVLELNSPLGRSLSANNVRLVADNCGKLRSFLAVTEYDHTALEYFFDKKKSTLVKVEFIFWGSSYIPIETMRVIGSCVKLEKLTLCASHVPLEPLKHLKFLKELVILIHFKYLRDLTFLEMSRESDGFDDHGLLSVFGSGFPFLEKLTLALNKSYYVSESTFEVISRSFGKLKHLDLRHFPHITDKGLNFLKRAKGLTSLELESFPLITNEGLLNLLMHLVSLERLCITCCECVTDDIKTHSTIRISIKKNLI